jgi:DNA repair protein RadA/Sms
MALAVLERRGGIRLAEQDVFTATVGGMRIHEPAADLALVLAVASAARDIPLPPDLVVLGEVGLAGEVRRVAGVKARLAEAARLGFTKALVPPDSGVIPEGISAVVTANLGAALQALYANAAVSE